MFNQGQSIIQLIWQNIQLSSHLKSFNTKNNWTYADGNPGLVQEQAQKVAGLKPADGQHIYKHNINLQI